VRPTQPVEIFRNIWYLGHPLTSTENFTEIVPGNPFVGGLNARGVAKDLSKAISQKRYKIGCELVLITNRKLYMSFRLVSKSVTLNDLERRNGPYFALFQRIRSLPRALWSKLYLNFLRHKCSLKHLVFSDISLT